MKCVQTRKKVKLVKIAAPSPPLFLMLKNLRSQKQRKKQRKKQKSNLSFWAQDIDRNHTKIGTTKQNHQILNIYVNPIFHDT